MENMFRELKALFFELNLCYHISMNDILNKLNKSKFRSSFKLKQKDIDYINSKGLTIIELHAKDFVNKRLKDKNNFIDGKQTPMKGHPVFISQHATATCCRTCLYKWHKIEINHVLTEKEMDYIVNVIMLWIKKQIKTNE